MDEKGGCGGFGFGNSWWIIILLVIVLFCCNDNGHVC